MDETEGDAENDGGENPAELDEPAESEYVARLFSVTDMTLPFTVAVTGELLTLSPVVGSLTKRLAMDDEVSP